MILKRGNDLVFQLSPNSLGDWLNLPSAIDQAMASKAMETVKDEDSFWREFPDMADYFSPGIVPLLKYLGLSSKQVMHQFGEQVGKDAAAKMSHLSVDQMLDEFSKVWEGYRIGRLTVESRDPLVIQISNCTVCGQLQGTGEMYECAFHEGFFQGAISASLGRPVTLVQKTNYEGEAGTWCRRLAADVSV
jgi:predicted hydrocarbon binding protein